MQYIMQYDKKVPDTNCVGIMYLKDVFKEYYKACIFIYLI